jgi:two-component system, LytTR family, sensor kinase
MLLARIRRHFSQNTEMYLPYFYPILMPLLTMYSSRVAIHTFQDALLYWLFMGFLQSGLLVIIQKILYLKSYEKWTKWLIAAFVGVLFLCLYWLMDYLFLHIIARLAFANIWQVVIRNTLNIPLLIALVEGIKSAAERKRLILNNIMLENENAQAQLNLLLQQINPHFLFNSLTVLQAMALLEDTRTEEFIVKLEEVYRQTLKTDKGTVTLREELDFFNAYMYLMNLRQENAIFAEVQVADEALNYRLPSFSLQLLAENCIKHNVVSEAKPLTIRLYQKDLQSLTIENNYQPKAKKNESFGIGIQNLKKRYKLEGITQGVLIEQNEITYSTTIKLF